jgi:hypothetical protein
MNLPILRSLAQLAGTPLEDEDLAQVAALLDRDDTRPSPDPTQAQDSNADLELESYRIDVTAVGVFRIGGECFVATAEFFPAPHAEQQAAQRLADLNQMAGRYHLDHFTADDLDPWEVDGEVRTTAVHGGYAQATEACQDGRRRLLGLLLGSAALRRVAGWETDTVLLGRGYDYYLLRTHRDGSIDLSYAEQPLDAYARYAKLVSDLAEELVPLDDRHRLGTVHPLLPPTVRAWLYREAAEAIGDQARVTLRAGLKGLVTTGELPRRAQQPGRRSVAKLANRLHIDPAKLKRAIAAAID